jgi:hypothetical protein
MSKFASEAHLMAKKGRKLAIKQSVKALYDRKRVTRSRPGRPDGNVSTSGAVKKREHQNNLRLYLKAQPPPQKAPEQTTFSAKPKARSIPFNTDDSILLLGEGEINFFMSMVPPEQEEHKAWYFVCRYTVLVLSSTYLRCASFCL